MRAAVVNRSGSFDVVDLADPVPGADELVLRVHACGICGSDLKVVDRMPAGTVLGHEFSGEIVAMGAKVTGWSVGEHVAAMPLRACWRCRWCLDDHPAHCDDVDRLGVGGSAGGFAELVRVQSAAAVALAPGAEGSGALVEPLAVGLHCAAMAELRPGDQVLVLGAGNVGAAVALWARRMGAGDVVVSDPVAHRREAVSAMASTDVHDPTEGPPPAGGFDVVFECVGAPGMVQCAIDAVAPRGSVVVGGVCLGPDQFVPSTAVMKEVQVRFAVYYGRREFAAAATLLGTGVLDASAFVTATAPLERISAAFEHLLRTDAERKVLIVPDQTTPTEGSAP